jgi:polar amino acid transport system substrate-binding protein
MLRPGGPAHVAAVLLLALGAIVPAQIARADAVHDQLAPTGRLRVAVAISALGGPFWCSRDASGKPAGVPVDLGAELARRLGVPVVYVPYENSGQITDAAASGAWDVTFVPEDAERAQKIAFGPIYNAADATFLVRAGSDAQTFAQLNQPGTLVAAVANTTTMRGAARAIPNATVLGFQTVDEIVGLLSRGEVEAFANLRDQLVPLSARMPGTRVLPGAFQQTKTAVAVPLGKPEALTYATAFVQDVMTNGFLRRSYDAHGLQNTPI